MIKLNFIPDQQRSRTAQLTGDDFGGVPGEVLVGGIAALIGFLLAVHLLFAVVAGYKFASYKILQVRWDMMGADKRAYDEVTNELKQLQTKMTELRPITSSQKLHWVNLLNDVSDSVPKGVWIRQISFDNGQLAIQGSAVSKIKNEMVEAGNFVSALKDRKSIKDNFISVDIESIQRRENTPGSIADFLLKAKRK
ncbi:MAG: PilN domain-containing protein [Candidatus Omnitrophica bacterium]|nr:PilN domain-containing protein [Candidatus Omnitrophota bacterium]